MSKMLQYHPQHRISAIEALCHPFFDPLRDPAAQLPNGHALPPLFNFSKRGMYCKKNVNHTCLGMSWLNHLFSRL